MNEVQVKKSSFLDTDRVTFTNGYMLKKSDDVAAFYIDVRGEVDRMYPDATSSVYDNGNKFGYPSIFLSEGDALVDLVVEIYFPEFENWSVHSCTGGKIIAVCLTKND